MNSELSEVVKESPRTATKAKATLDNSIARNREGYQDGYGESNVAFRLETKETAEN